MKYAFDQSNDSEWHEAFASVGLQSSGKARAQAFCNLFMIWMWREVKENQENPCGDRLPHVGIPGK